MTLEELINSHKEVIKYSEKMKSLASNTNDINRLIKQHTQELEYLEELKTLRVELEKNSKELEDYKKALGLACNIIEEHAYCPYMCDGNRRCIDCLLQKARGQE